MKITYTKKFLKQLYKIPKDPRSKMEKFVFEILPEMSSIGESGKIEKMTGYQGFYKIRFGTYRIGLKIEKDTIVLKTVMHRSNIYQFFP
ncbi:type II toxin-antitoxin system RelE/ParE family toxin [Desulfobacterales bacterium HSG16]|nr:type II toxin-antitoxin system RelE/ParE family toxin [Desulfobacterales bacterium HSG16]